MSTSPDHDFNTWLDSFVAGRSTPATPVDTDSSGLRDAARQFHGLARRAERETTSVDPITSDWSTFMQIHVADPPVSSSPEIPVPGPRPRTRIVPNHASRWQVALNMTLAALLVVTIGVGLWRASGGFSGPTGPDSRQAAFAPETRTFEPAGTPDAQTNLPVIPAPNECTVEPLTIDEVLWYVENPSAAMRGESSRTPSTPVGSSSDPTQAPDGEVQDGETVVLDSATPTDLLIASPPAAYEVGPASPAQLAAMASLQRMWMACVLADSPFQRWALESPLLVAEQVQMLLPAFASRDEAVAILEDVQATGMMEASEDFRNQPGATFLSITSQGFPMLDSIAVIEPDNAVSWTEDGRTFWVTYSSYDMDGTLLHDGALLSVETPTSGEPTPVPGGNGTGGCFSYGFTWLPDLSELRVSWIPRCG